MDKKVLFFFEDVKLSLLQLTKELKELIV